MKLLGKRFARHTVFNVGGQASPSWQWVDKGVDELWHVSPKPLVTTSALLMTFSLKT